MKTLEKIALLGRVEKLTKNSLIYNMMWADVVNKVILPQMAGRERYAIGDSFMQLLADYPYDIMRMDAKIAKNLLEIAMQRISCGAVLHEPTSWPEPLDKEYFVYSSRWDEPNLMTESCYSFIMKASETCLKDEQLKGHMVKILFGILKHISPQGDMRYGYMCPLLEEDPHKALALWAHAERMVEQYASYEELYKNYVQPEIWYEHRLWISQNFSKINWRKFCKRTKCVSGNNFLQRSLNKRKLRKELRSLQLPVAR